MNASRDGSGMDERRLGRGCRVGIVAPAGPPDPEDLEIGSRRLREMGFEVVLDPGVHRKVGRYAGTGAERFDSLRTMMMDPELTAILFARGGYGCMHLLPDLFATPFSVPPKRVMGFSDITALAPWFARQPSVLWVHGPMLAQLVSLDAADRGRVGLWLSGAPVSERIEGERLQGEGEVTGPIVCANLTTLNHLMGTPWMPALSGCILVLEDVGEYPYRIDRMMCQFSQAGILDHVAAVCLGEFVECGTWEELEPCLLSHIPETCPVLSGLPIGHGSRNVPVPNGVIGHVDANTFSWRCE